MAGMCVSYIMQKWHLRPVRMSLRVRLLRRLIAFNMTKSPLVVSDVYHHSIICFKSAFEGFLFNVH